MTFQAEGIETKICNVGGESRAALRGRVNDLKVWVGRGRLGHWLALIRARRTNHDHGTQENLGHDGSHSSLKLFSLEGHDDPVPIEADAPEASSHNPKRVLHTLDQGR